MSFDVFTVEARCAIKEKNVANFRQVEFLHFRWQNFILKQTYPRVIYVPS